ncbi:MAG: hypothetical protein ISS94_00615 [Candidatus Syntrophoarchaeum sp.]|nr:hypothetical protein [Methanomicrobia archaeon]MBL7117278.1 hypothetical protein [Candidatus Syntrophoarchaeum sp.]
MSRKELIREVAKEVSPYPALCIGILLILNFVTSLQNYYPLTSAGVLPIIIFFSGLSIHSAGTALSHAEQKEKAQPIFISTGIMMTGYALWKGFQYLISIHEVPSKLALFINTLGLAIFAGFALAALVTLAVFGEKSKSLIVSGIFKWLVNSQLSFMLIACFIVIYFGFFRPQILINWQHLQLLDWIIVVMMVWGSFSSVRGSINRNLSAPLTYSDWEKHTQKIENKIDEDLEYAERVQWLFVEDGIKEELVVYLVGVLQENGSYSQQSISQQLSPLINYQDEPVPSPSFEWVKNRVSQRNRKNREMLLAELMEIIKPKS